MATVLVKTSIGIMISYSVIEKLHLESTQQMQFKLWTFGFLVDFNMGWKEWKSPTETTKPRKRDFRCSSICCKRK